ncbi:MAG: calcium/sodium antiporter [Candidatus Thermoplasmatota archaeon]|nr:calcium/sodium antiporter [archaeon]MBU3902385.1 calcium/sodium antiporter [Candidatus Thermoplasmatota archaeon]
MMIYITSLPVSLLVFILGVLLLYKGADFLIDGASKTAVRLGVSSLIVALTVVAYGTSMPEFAVSFLASLKGHTDIAVGNILGSCIANLLLVLGISAVIKPIKVTKTVVIREAPIMALSSFLLLLLSVGYVLDKIDGIILLLCFSAYIIFFIWIAKKTKNKNNYNIESSPMSKNAVLIVVGIIGIVIGARFLVDSSIFFAKTFGISEAVIALSLIAIGTSLPELAVSGLASWKGESDISIGNIIGSNIFNILLVLGACLAVTSIIIDQKLFINMLLVCVVSIIVIPMLYTGYVLSRKEGVVLLIGYACYLMWLYL